MNRRDPRIRQTLDRITTTLESANTATQTGFYDFSSKYLNPCLGSVSECLSSACAPCVELTRERARARQRALLRSQRPEAVFDFYADWDDDPYEYESGLPGENVGGEGGGRRGGASGSGGGGGGGGGGSTGGAANERTGLLSGWGVDELDRLLAGRPKEDQQPRRQRGMTYGTARTTRRGSGKGTAGGTSTTGGAKGELLDDPNVVPSSSKFGFLERLPFKFGPRGLRYKPSAANLQEGVLRRGGGRRDEGRVSEAERERERRRERTEGEALLEDMDGEEEGEMANEREDKFAAAARRSRSNTVGSGHTDTSLSSRGDLFPSDDEDDAVMLDDDIAFALVSRRNTDDFESSAASNSGSGSGRRRRPSMSRKSTGSKASSGGSGGGNARSLSGKGRSLSGDSIASPTILESPEPLSLPLPAPLPSIDDLRREEERVRRDEQAEVERKREEARQLALAKGLIGGRQHDATGKPAEMGDAPSRSDETSKEPDGASEREPDEP